jgi:hypothetical protein
MRRLFLTSLLLATVAAPAAADDQPPPPGTTQGPMTVERTTNGWVIAPDVEIGSLGGSTATHAGAYGGWMFENTLLIGGAAYWQVNRSGPKRMDYGGFIAEWLVGANRPIGFGARALIGGGGAELESSFVPVPVPYGRDGNRFAVPVPSGPVRFELHDGFVIFEPQANLLVNINQRLRIRAAGGYRFIDANPGVAHQLHGASGSIGLEIGGTKTTRIAP